MALLRAIFKHPILSGLFAVTVGGIVLLTLIVVFLDPIKAILADQFWFSVILSLAIFGLVMTAVAYCILLERKITAIAYEQIEDDDGNLCVMHPLSEIGGRMAGQIAANLLQNNMGGNGVLLSGMPGVPPAEVVIIGCGVVGTYAAKTLQKMGAHITCLDVDLGTLQRIHDNHPDIVTMFSTNESIARACAYADVVITAAMHPGQIAPVLVTREILRGMKTRSIIMDLSIDLGGCVETSRPTTHDNPTFVEEGVTHYCVPNIPSVVARTATHASFNAAFPYILEIVTHGVEKAIENNSALAKAVNTHGGKIYNLSRLASKTG